MSSLDKLSDRLVEQRWSNSSIYWLLPEYALAIDPDARGLSVHIFSGDNWTVGHIGDYDLMLGAAVEDVVGLVQLLDSDLAHAKEWIMSDARNGHLCDDPSAINNFDALWATKAHPKFYLLGCGDLTKDHDDWIGVTEAEEARMHAHIASRDPRGLIGKGLHSGAVEDAREGYLLTLQNAVNTWIVRGALRDVAVMPRSPGR